MKTTKANTQPQRVPILQRVGSDVPYEQWPYEIKVGQTYYSYECTEVRDDTSLSAPIQQLSVNQRKVRVVEVKPPVGVSNVAYFAGKVVFRSVDRKRTLGNASATYFANTFAPTPEQAKERHLHRCEQKLNQFRLLLSLWEGAKIDATRKPTKPKQK